MNENFCSRFGRKKHCGSIRTDHITFVLNTIEHISFQVESIRTATLARVGRNITLRSNTVEHIFWSSRSKHYQVASICSKYITLGLNTIKDIFLVESIKTAILGRFDQKFHFWVKPRKSNFHFVRFGKKYSQFGFIQTEETYHAWIENS